MSSTTSSSYQFPSIHDFPPFYTRQPTETTWQNQALQWSDLILKYARHYRIFTLNLNQATTPGASPLFENTRIKRRLSLETLQEVIEFMVQQGTAKWGDNKTEALLFWRKPDDWADLIAQWVIQSGLNNNIVTTYEIAHGELAEGQEFYEIDHNVLLLAIQVLVKRGVAQLFKGTDNENMGVKFFGIK
ncbi:ESCRT-II complex subunit-domain-containing protein [Halteromyces radiatus]|uniref:ESCRT-II complex subunit-domain-containing protein n=1 Tax=Halteromyces radiatus TaxID=101107 RepID=UPI00221EED99|nr:ESCRT-II complex subunit-domain-containing protein [Halteromyces radiatus]KAI8077775.1 ESCRT-II complex subunit-domain-containing protein [Halteromyces radiatus]